MGFDLTGKLKRSFQRGGLVGTIRECLSALGYYATELRNRRIRRANIKFDEMFNVTTSAKMELSALDIPSPNRVYGTNYSGIPENWLDQVIRSLRIPYEDFLFVDLGSGMGKSILVASYFPFRKIVGIEFSPELNDIARKNIVTFNSPKKQCHDIESICMDATEYAFPTQPTVLYLWNPFGEEVMKVVLSRLEDSLRQNPRDMIVVYYGPRLSRLWDGSQAFRKVRATKYYCIYRTAQLKAS